MCTARQIEMGFCCHKVAPTSSLSTRVKYTKYYIQKCFADIFIFVFISICLIKRVHILAKPAPAAQA